MHLPDEYTTYVHRIGRTGRIHEGIATSFFDPSDPADLKISKDLLEVRFPSITGGVTHCLLGYQGQRSGSAGVPRGGRQRREALQRGGHRRRRVGHHRAVRWLRTSRPGARGRGNR